MGRLFVADDDNTYSIKIFQEEEEDSQSDAHKSRIELSNRGCRCVTHTKVSVWPVGLVGGLRYEGPLVTGGKVGELSYSLKTHNRFPIDMAGFAVSLTLLLNHPKGTV
ncbi:unnamed protein product [Ranitomeya imitator]|uniref:Galactosylgalactosylxylosylprotein 3-beta-glucuronosyltransferase n=1 Tax=Ranitomeya imitator TaxID=111125 RepID=A0ABN9M875_9NEOB|nr:unnamed protein product [Ranitomeya imitator]